MSSKIDDVVAGTTLNVDAWAGVNQGHRDISLQTSQMATLKSRLENGQSGEIQVASDSTGDGDAEWVRLFADYLAESYPDHNVDYALKTDVDLGDYTKTRLNAGGLGDRYFSLAGGADTKVMYQPTAFSSSDLECVVRASIDDFASGNDEALAAQWGNSGFRRFHFYKKADGSIILFCSEDGSTGFTAVSWADPSLTLSNATPYWFQVLFDADDGAGGSVGTINWKVNEGDAWTLGATLSTASTRSLFDTTQNFNAGCRSDGGGARLVGDLYECQIKDGIGGADLVPRNIDKWNKSFAFFSTGSTVEGSPTITVWNAAQGGITLDSLASQVGYFSQVGCDVYILSGGLNDGYNTGGYILDDNLATIADYWSSWGAVYITAQNQKILGTTVTEQYTIDVQNDNIQRCTLFAINNGYGYIDVNREFLNDGRDLSVLINADGVHPSDEGKVVWGDLVIDTFDRSY